VSLDTGDEAEEGGTDDAEFGDSIGFDLVPPAQASQGGSVYKDASGAEWAGGALCLADACIEATITEAAEEDMQSASDGTVPVAIGYETLWLLLYIFPMLAAVFALIPSLVICGGKWHSTCACLNQVCFCALMVPALFMSALFFGQVMVGSDVCRAFPAIAVEYAAGSAPSLCEDTFSGTVVTTDPTDFGLCEVTQSGNVVQFRPAALMAGLFGTCGTIETEGSGAHAIASVYQSFANQLDD